MVLELQMRLVATMTVDVGRDEIFGFTDAVWISALNATYWPATNCHGLHETMLRIIVVYRIMLG
jgi:hypothetical protein